MLDNAGPTDPHKPRRLAQHYLNRTRADSARLHRTTSMAARAMRFPIGQINILDDRFQYTIAEFGVDAQILPREKTVCHFLVDDGAAVLAVDDLLLDERYRNLPAVRNGSVRSYLGVPLVGREATTVGTLCFVDDRPRRITEDDIERLLEFGEIVQDQLELTRRNAEFPAAREVRTLLAGALAAEEIVPWYQPVVDLRTDTRPGFEALARWRRPDGSVISPQSFVAAAEDSDLVIDLDRAVARAALRDLARWRTHKPQLRMGVNLSTRHLELPDGASFVLDALTEEGLNPEGIVVEITETRLLSDFAQAAAAVAELRAAGMRVLLDDFANGWSSLDWLLGLGASGIKIDRSVTMALGTKIGDAVCRAVVSMTAELGMSTTIEGIGDETQLAAAKAHGFWFGQGYYWSPPVPSVVVDATL